MRHLTFLVALSCLVAPGCGSEPEEAVEKTTPEDGRARPPAPAWDLAAAVQQRKLPNGLTILIREKHSAPVVTCELAFKVGAVDEREKERGLAHFLEHMLFKGSASYGVGEIDLVTKRMGGWNNAYTSRDMTAYHFTMPTSGLDTALKILSEMLGSSTLDDAEFRKEKGPVFNELRAGLDEPWDRLWEAVHAKAYSVHPYRHPVIGYEPEIEAMTQAQMKAFYDKYYKPTNAVLVIVGDVDPAATFAKVESMFGTIPRGTPVPALDVVEPPQQKEIRFENKEDVEVDRLLLAWRGPRAGEADDYVLDVVSHLFGTGRTARLHQRLVEKDELASSVGVSNYSGRFPGTFVVNVEALPGADRGAIEKALDEEVKRLGDEGPTKEELEKARNSVMAGFIFRAESSNSLADLIAWYACCLKLEDLGGYIARMEKITAEDVKACVKKYFRAENRTVGWSIAGGGGGGGGGGGEAKRALRRQGREPGGAAGGASLDKARRVVLDNGLVLLVLENRDLPIVSIQSFTRASQLYETEDQAGLAALVGQLLEDGTATRSADQIAAAMEFVGGRLGTSTSGVEASVLTKDADLAFEIVFDILMNSSFPEDMVEQRREQALADIAASREQPSGVARQAFMEAVYGKHPHHRPARGYEDTVKALTRDDCLAHYRKYFIPNNTTLAVVGDVSPEQVEKKVRELTAAWKVKLLDFPDFAPAEKAAKGTTKGIPFEKSQQVNVFMGHLGIRRADPDYYALLVMDNILGTGSGFTDRLSKRIREQMGAAYAVSANLTSTAGTEPGTFRAFMATKPQDYAASLAALREEIDRIRTQKATAEELDAAKDYLVGGFALEMETNAQLADMLLYVERFGLGFDYPKTFVAKVKAVTAEDVLRVAAKHLDPAAMSMVVAGPVDENGNLKSK